MKQTMPKKIEQEDIDAALSLIILSGTAPVASPSDLIKRGFKYGHAVAREKYKTDAQLLHDVCKDRDAAKALLREVADRRCEWGPSASNVAPCRFASSQRQCLPCRARAHLEEQK